MNEETCQNCALREGCIRRDLAIFQLFIATGRDDEVPEPQEKVNIRPGCPDWKGGRVDVWRRPVPSGTLPDLRRADVEWPVREL